MIEAYKEKIKFLSEAIVEAQKPIRILDSIKWNHQTEETFFAKGAKELPKVDKAYYQSISIGFDPAQKRSELADIRSSIVRELGADDAVGALLVQMVDQYSDVITLLEARGTPEFWQASKKLYGSPKDLFFDDTNTILSQGKLLFAILSRLEGKFLGAEYPKEIPAERAVEILRERFSKTSMRDRIEVRISDGIVADAAAGSDLIKIRKGSVLSKKDIDIFEVHEGWVHVCTTANGKMQPFAKWLSKGPPRCSATQEGLAFLMEILTFSTYPRRARTVNNRILGIDLVENGADFIELYRFYRGIGHDESESYQNSMRVFRGGVITGGAPFTKDIAYCRGFIENYNFIRSAIRRGKPEIIPFLYAGKLHVDDVPLLYQLHERGIVDAPSYLPPAFEDLNGLAVWMSFSNFLNTIDLSKVQSHYDGLFKKYL